MVPIFKKFYNCKGFICNFPAFSSPTSPLVPSLKVLFKNNYMKSKGRKSSLLGSPALFQKMQSKICLLNSIQPSHSADTAVFRKLSSVIYTN